MNLSWLSQRDLGHFHLPPFVLHRLGLYGLYKPAYITKQILLLLREGRRGFVVQEGSLISIKKRCPENKEHRHLPLFLLL